MGTPANDHPRCFWRADFDEAVATLVGVIREVRPQVLVTYDENGGYGHPDHIQAHRIAMAALDPAADPAVLPDCGHPWRVAKAYWTAVPHSVLQAGIEALRATGDTSFFNGIERAEDLPFAVPDELITTAVDARDYLDAKMDAMRAYPTQISMDGPFFALSNNIGQRGLGIEYFRLIRGEPGHSGANGREDDLFAGLL